MGNKKNINNSNLAIGPYKFTMQKTKICVEKKYFGFQFGSKLEGFLIKNINSINFFSSNNKIKENKNKEFFKKALMEKTNLNKMLNHINAKINLISFLLVFIALIVCILPTSIANSGFVDFIFILAVTAFLMQFDISRKTTFIFFDIDDKSKKKYTKIINAFKELSKSKKIWFIKNKKSQYYKTNAGASTSLDRKESNIEFGNRKYIYTNILPPSVKVSNGSLYFFPEFVLFIEKTRNFKDIDSAISLIFGKIKVSRLLYDELDISLSYSNFREEQKIPKDSEIVKYTSKFANKDGSADKRFKDNNKRIPIVKYGVLKIKGKENFYKELMVSNVSLLKAFLQNFQ